MSSSRHDNTSSGSFTDPTTFEVPRSWNTGEFTITATDDSPMALSASASFFVVPTVSDRAADRFARSDIDVGTTRRRQTKKTKKVKDDYNF